MMTNTKTHPWKAGDRALYVNGPPWWSDIVGGVVVVVHAGWTNTIPRQPCATIRREDTGDTCAVSADTRHRNIRPVTA